MDHLGEVRRGVVGDHGAGDEGGVLIGRLIDSPVDQVIVRSIAEIARTLHDGPGRSRPVHVVLENDANQASLLQHADAQWNDDLHHAAHVLLTGETDGYYADYADAPLARFGRALAEGFVYQGECPPGGVPRGSPSAA